MGQKVITAVLTLFLAACETPKQVTGDACGPFQPIRPLQSDMDTMSAHLTNQIGVHNFTGADLCNWAP